ncbi:hypothetical protein ACFWIJ_40315, partial [Streptomyces sp. NPDC127079]
MLAVDAELTAQREGILLISDKGFASKVFEKDLAELGVELLRPSFKREKVRCGEPILKKVRQLIASVNDTLKGQLILEPTRWARSPPRQAAVSAAASVSFPSRETAAGSASRHFPEPFLDGVQQSAGSDRGAECCTAWPSRPSPM